jgi:transcriptional regulator with XRE-family HTH domain
MGFAARLQELREGAGLSQPGLADRAGIPVDSIQNWEQGRTRPRLDALLKLARALDVSLDTLVVAEEAGPARPRRPRGRPRKDAAENPAAAVKKPRGRPRKEK